MNAFDPQAEDSTTTIGRNLRSRPLARKKLSEMVEEELEQMIRRREFGEGEQLPSERELMAPCLHEKACDLDPCQKHEDEAKRIRMYIYIIIKEE